MELLSATRSHEPLHFHNFNLAFSWNSFKKWVINRFAQNQIVYENVLLNHVNQHENKSKRFASIYCVPLL